MNSETLFELDDYTNPANQPLDNTQHERFCQTYAGKSFGNATEAYLETYGGENKEAAANNASRLLRAPAIRRRIQHLRDEMIIELGIDRLEIARIRAKLARQGKASDRLTALRDLEKGLGIAAAEKLTIEGQLETTSTLGLLHIANPALLTTLCEAARSTGETQ